jgi:HEAT repeat protein
MSDNKINQWIADLLEGDRQTQMQAFNNLEAHGNAQMVKPLTQIIKDQSKDAKVRHLAIDVLVTFGDPAVNEVLLDILQDTDPKVRTSALWGLRDIGDRRAIEPLSQVLRQDNSPSVRAVAAITLGTLAGDLAVQSLITTLAGDQSGFVRACAAESLGIIADPAAIGPLIAALKDSDEDVRQEAAVKLGVFGDEAAVKPLIASMNDDEHVYVRKSAVQSLEIIGSLEALAAVTAWRRKDKGSV